MKAGLAIGLVIPDLWQQEAIRALQQGKDVVVQAPTGSGKTYIFELFYPDLKEQAVFTVPTRALANDKLAEWRARGWDVGISTGDVALTSMHESLLPRSRRNAAVFYAEKVRGCW